MSLWKVSELTSREEIIIKRIDGIVFAKMMISAANNIYNNKQLIDELNVFPVPDGDTGTNMSLTSRAMAASLAENTNSSLTKSADVAANATLRGARGNSGVILSQFYRGISKSLKGKKDCDAEELAKALKDGSDTAYKAVMNPTEGTILTVAREAANGAILAAQKGMDIIETMSEAVKQGNAALDRTPEMLPALKQAGVVDSGGKGWMCILEGALAYLNGNEVTSDIKETQQSVKVQKNEVKQNIKYSYCTEFIVEKSRPDVNVDMFRHAIEKKGDCMLVIDDDEIVKVHIHTNHPGFILEKAILLGSMINIKIDNMKHQHNSIIQNEEKKPQETQTVQEEQEEKQDIVTAENAEPVIEKQNTQKSKYGFVAVCTGEGFEAILKDLGVSKVIKGGQTMNPSTDDILNAVNEVNAETVFVFPNNKNIIMAANQARELTEKKIVVIPTRSVPECVSAMVAYNENAESDVNEKNMISAVRNVKTGHITYAVRDTQIEDKEIKAGDVIGINGGQIDVVGGNADSVCEELVAKMVDDDSEFITIYYGGGVDAQQADILASKLEEKYEDAEILLKYGGQPIYYYIVSVE